MHPGSMTQDSPVLTCEAFTELARGILDKGTPLRFRAHGFSMHPFIKGGDIITVSPCRNAELVLGDIAAFIHPSAGKLLVHRVVSRRGRGYLMRGDSMFATDGVVPETAILGRVNSIERNDKNISLGLGAERAVIAILSRSLILPAAVQLISHLMKAIGKRQPA